MKINLGVVGFGEFSCTFLELFMKHPNVERVVGAELMEDRREQIARQFGIDMYASFEEMLEKDKNLNAVAIFTQRHLHGPMAIAALKVGKHVFSAVPMGCTVEEVAEIVKIVSETGLTYMTAETCYYFPCAEFCRKKYKEGYFGDFVYGEAQYHHDIKGMFGTFAGSGGSDWKKVAGIPPMYYSTHSMSMMFSSVNDYPTEVTCFGFVDNNGDDIYGAGKNHWDNPFSNETAILKMSKGGFARINEFRRIGTMKPSSYITGLYGKLGAYEGSGMHHTIIRGEPNEKIEVEDVSSLINTFDYEKAKPNMEHPEHGMLDYTAYHTGYSAIHNTERLPEEIRDLKSKFGYQLHGHNGSHRFLVDDFARAVCKNLVPPNNAWDSAVYAVSGIVAHDSAMAGGKTLPIPFFGKAPEGSEEKWEENLSL